MAAGTGSKSSQSNDADVERLQRETQELIEALTAPAYVAALRAVKDAPESERLLEASKRLTPDALRAQGVPLPEGMRISSRYFEKGYPEPLEFGDLPDGRPNPLTALSELDPGLLDKMRSGKPQLLNQLVSDESGEVPNNFTMARFGGCTCGGRVLSGPMGIGSTSVCGGAGFQL